MAAAFRVTAKIEGLEEFIRKLNGATDAYKLKYLRRAMGKATVIVKNSAKPMVPVRSGQLQKSIGTSTRAYKDSTVVVGFVEPKKGFKTLYGNRGGASAASGRTTSLRWIDPRKYAHLVERGTRPRYVKAGMYRGAAPPKPFLGPAFDRSRSRIATVFEGVMAEALAYMVT